MADELQPEKPKKPRKPWRKVKNGGKVSAAEKARKKRRRQRLLDEKEVREAVEGIKASRGGKRNDAGRPKNYLRDINTPPLQAHAIWLCIDELHFWKQLLNSPSEAIRLQTGIYLKDRQLGKPVQPEVTATVGKYDHLTSEELTQKILEFIEENAESVGLTISPTDDAPAVPVAALPPATAPVEGPWSVNNMADYNDPPGFKPASYEPPVVMPPEPAEKEYFCPKRGHGKYFKPKDQKSDMCPLCIADGLRDRDYLGSLMPA
jgi:hypothetical protein